MTNVQAFICEQLSNVPDRSPQFDRNQVMIRCPYHSGGQERTPSFKVNLEGSRYEVGTGYCYACKKRTSWNELAETLGVQGLKTSNIVHGVSTFSFGAAVVRLPELGSMIAWPDQPWRNISSETIRRYDGRLEYRSREVMLYLPVHIGSEYVGGIHCVMAITPEEKKAGRKAYLNVDGAWSASSVYGYNQAKKMPGPLFVVEGPRDTLRVAELGGRVIGMLGAAVTTKKVELIRRLDPPLIVSLFDPDDAGDLAHDKLKSLMRKSYIPIRRIRLPEGRDPANLTPKSIRKVYSLLEESRVAS